MKQTLLNAFLLKKEHKFSVKKNFSGLSCDAMKEQSINILKQGFSNQPLTLAQQYGSVLRLRYGVNITITIVVLAHIVSCIQLLLHDFYQSCQICFYVSKKVSILSIS